MLKRLLVSTIILASISTGYALQCSQDLRPVDGALTHVSLDNTFARDNNFTITHKSYDRINGREVSRNTTLANLDCNSVSGVLSFCQNYAGEFVMVSNSAVRTVSSLGQRFADVKETVHISAHYNGGQFSHDFDMKNCTTR